MLTPVILNSTRPPDQYLAHLVGKGKEWRESTLPRQLRQRGIYAVRVKRSGDQLRIELSGGQLKGNPAFVGRVVSAPSGSRLVGRFTFARADWIGAAIFVSWTAGLGAWASHNPWVGAAGAAIGLGGVVSVSAVNWYLHAEEREGLVAYLRDEPGAASDVADPAA